MAKIKNTGSAKNAEAVDSIQHQEVLMKENYKKNARALTAANNQFIDFRKKDDKDFSSMKEDEAH